MFLTTDEFYRQQLGFEPGRYQKLVTDVKAALGDERGGMVRVGASLYRFKCAIRKRRTTSFFQYCEAVFKMDRTHVSRYIQVIEEFGNEDKSALAEEYAEYSFSILLELLKIPREERHKVSPDWTVKNVREFRRVLERREDPDDEDAEAPPSDRYIRFKKWKRSDLCEKILALEEELKIEREINQKKGNEKNETN